MQEGVDVDDFPVIVKIPIANTSNLYGTGETADTIYFECEGEILKHELIEITATYLIAWIKMNLEALYKKVVTLHYGALVDNNYEDKRAVWVNGVNIYHFNGDGTDSMGINNLSPSANVVFDTIYGTHYKGVYIPNGHKLSGTAATIAAPNTVVVLGLSMSAGDIGTSNYFISGSSSSLHLLSSHSIIYNPAPGYYTNRAGTDLPLTFPNKMNLTYSRTAAGNNFIWYVDAVIRATEYIGTVANDLGYGYVGGYASGTSATPMSISEIFIFNDVKSPYWILALQRLYRNPDAYIEYGTEVDLDNLTDFTDEKVCCIANIVRQLEIYDYDFKKMVYEVGAKNAYWRVPGSGEGIYVWGKLEMRPLYGEDVSFVDNLYANDAYFYTFTDYTYDIHDKLDVEGVLYDIQAIQVHDAGSETIYKTLVLKRQPEYYACCVGVVS